MIYVFKTIQWILFLFQALISLIVILSWKDFNTIYTIVLFLITCTLFPPILKRISQKQTYLQENFKTIFSGFLLFFIFTMIGFKGISKSKKAQSKNETREISTQTSKEPNEKNPSLVDSKIPEPQPPKNQNRDNLKIEEATEKLLKEDGKQKEISKISILLEKENLSEARTSIKSLLVNFQSDIDVKNLLKKLESLEYRRKEIDRISSLLTKKNFSQARYSYTNLLKAFPDDNEILKLGTSIEFEETKFNDLNKIKGLMKKNQLADARLMLLESIQKYPEDPTFKDLFVELEKLERIAEDLRIQKENLSRFKTGIKDMESFTKDKKWKECVETQSSINELFPNDKKFIKLKEVCSKENDKRIAEEEESRSFWMKVKIILAIFFFFCYLSYGYATRCSNCGKWHKRKLKRSEHIRDDWQHETKKGTPDHRYKDNIKTSVYRNYFICKNCKHEWTEIQYI